MTTAAGTRRARDGRPGTAGRGRLPQLVFRTQPRGWLALAGVSVLLTVSLLLENAAFPKGGALTPLILLSGALAAAACLLSYPLPFLGLLLAVGLAVANTTVPGMPHGGGTQLITLLFLIGFLAFRLPGRWSVGAWAVAAVTVGVSAAVSGGEVFEVVFYLLFLAPAWVVGALLARERSRSAELSALAAELAAEREQNARNAVLADRARIARELHDAVAHRVSVMTLQVGVVRRRLGDLPAEQDTLAQAERLGRRSVDELRRIVGLVRTAGPELAPVASLSQLDDLVASVRAAGTRIDLTRTGSLDAVSPTLGVTAYRLVQEGVTNALKHAPGSAVDVRVDVDSDALRVRVADDGPAPSVVVPGHGLTGMRERVGAFGGSLTHGPGPDGGFVVTARLPLSADAAPPGRSSGIRSGTDRSVGAGR